MVFFSLSLVTSSQDRVLPPRFPSARPGPVHVHRRRGVLERSTLQPNTGKENLYKTHDLMHKL